MNTVTFTRLRAAVVATLLGAGALLVAAADDTPSAAQSGRMCPMGTTIVQLGGVASCRSVNR